MITPSLSLLVSHVHLERKLCEKKKINSGIPNEDQIKLTQNFSLAEYTRSETSSRSRYKDHRQQRGRFSRRRFCFEDHRAENKIALNLTFQTNFIISYINQFRIPKQCCKRQVNIFCCFMFNRCRMFLKCFREST